jgi:predicted ATPase
MTVLRWKEFQPDLFKEFVDVSKSLGLFESLDMRAFKSDRKVRGEVPEEIASLQIDASNVGLASDGTLRLMEIVVCLLSTDDSIAFIEEPETAVHPGMLRRLLSVVDSYSADRQVIMSTHSPIVVDHVGPQSLRLVERKDHRTTVRKLDTRESSLVRAYLENDGSLGDFVYSGGIDEP